jgi:hypothetical protein
VRGRHDQVSFYEVRSGKIYDVIRKSFEMTTRLYPPKWSYLGGKVLEAPDKDVIQFPITNKGSS